MNLRTRIRFVAGLALLLSIVVAEGVAAHSPLPGAPDLPMHIDGPVDVRPLNQPAPRVPPVLALPAPGVTQLLPNWEVGRSAAMLLPNYEPGLATFELLNFGAISGLAPLLVAPRAAPTCLDKP
jgi:hypothetical protein